MDIYFKDSSGSRVGYISGENIKDNGGNRTGYINGNDIKDSGGNRIGFLNGQDFKDNYGNRVGYINGNDIKDAYGNRVGYAESNASNIEMCAAGLLLFGLEAAETHQESSSYERPQREKPEGFLGWAIFIIAWFLLPFYENIRYFKYTAARIEWWGTIGRMFLLMMALTLIGIGHAGTNAVLIVMGIILIPIILVSLRRMRDIGKSWWWILIPFANFVMCGFFPGED